MNKNDKSICFVGNSEIGLPQDEEELEKLKMKIRKEINLAVENNIDTFYFSAFYGFELMCANLVLLRKKVINIHNPKFIKLIAIVPCEEQAINWIEKDRDLYYNTLSQCDHVILMNQMYKEDCLLESKKYMVQHSSRLICYCNSMKGETVNIINYAKNKNLKVTNLYLKKKI